MPKLYALLVGIDSYLGPVEQLSGCVNDVDLAAGLLTSRVEESRLCLRTLRNQEATRAALIDSFREHLGQAGPGDTALFWFSGHGSTGPLPPEIWYSEAEGSSQTTVCHDSRQGGVPDLYDKELAVLVHEVVASGAFLVTIKDSCHSQGGMRDTPGDAVARPPTGLPPRLAPALRVPPTVAELLPELVRDAADRRRPIPGSQAPNHVALSACESSEVANEEDFDGRIHGVFSEALRRTLTRLGPDTTYREVLSYARCLVEGRFRRQVPMLEPPGPGPADQQFLGGELRPPVTDVTMRRLRGDWEINIGAVHGVASADTDGGTWLAVHGTTPPREVRVVAVHPERSLVEPVGWTPDPESQYKMVLTRVPLPAVAVVIDGPAAGVERLTAALATAGPGGAASPHVRVIAAKEASAARLLLRVRIESGLLLLTSADHEPLATPVTDDAEGIRRTVGDLEHVARWLQIRNLANPGSALAGAVRLEVLPAGAGERTIPAGGKPYDGAISVEYTGQDGRWEPPSVFVRLRNTSDQRLYCVLLDLTDRYRMHADLFPGNYVPPRMVAAAASGGTITVSLPPGRPVEPGATAKDWFVLLVAETEFSADPFYLPRLREQGRRATRSTRAITGILDRLGLAATTRDAGAGPAVALDWTTTVLEIQTSVPRPEGE